MTPHAEPPLPPDLLGARAESSRGAWGFAIACVVVAFWDLGGRSLLHRDVSRFATIARDMLRSGDFLVPVRDGEVYANKPVLFPWLVALGSWLLGAVTAFTTRLPSVLALVWMAHTTAAWGAFRSGSRSVGRIAGLLLLTTFFVHELGRVGRPDLLAAACGTCAAFRLDRACSGRGRRADPWVAGAALGFGIFAKGPPILVLPLFVLLLPRAGTRLRERVARARPGVLLALAVAIPAAWFVPATLRVGWSFARRLGVDQVATRVAGEANHEEPPWYYLVEWWVSAAPWSLLYVAAAVAFASRRVRAALGGGAHVAAVAATFAAFSAFPTKEIRYFAPLVPPFAVALAQLVPVVASRTPPARAALALRGLAAFLLVGAVVAAVAIPGASDEIAALLGRPAAIAWVVPPVAFAVAALLGALLFPRGERSSLALAGRTAGLALGVAAAALCVYWPALARYRVVERDRENRAVAAALAPGVPTYLVGGGSAEPRLTPEALFYGAPDATFVAAPASLPSLERAPDVQIVLVARDVEAVRAARPGGSFEARPVFTRRKGGEIVVVRSTK